MKEVFKKTIVTSAVGLNAAAIVFLYSNFVPRVEYEKLHNQHTVHVEKYEVLKERVVVQEATLNIYRDLVSRPYQ